ncbi:MAG: polysaccharide deacetylase family protein [Bacteroides sp.]|nr:polysaccharide deacetylase family protein [Bacteroides sp.]
MTGSLGGTEAQAQENSNFSWPEGKVAAVCLTYDDGLDCHLDVAVPALDKHGLKGTFYCSGFSSSLNQRIDEWRKIAGDGHELGNHTLFHPCDGEKFDWVKPEYDLNSYSLDQLMIELRTANTLLEAVDGKKVRSFAYTCADNSIDGVSFMDSIPTLFPSARGEGPIPESMRDVDLFYAPSWGVIDPSGEDLIAYVEDAWAKGTMAVFMFHSVGGGYLNVSEEAHTILLEYLERNKDDLWTDTFLNVMNHVIKEQ